MLQLTVAIPVYNSGKHLQANFDSLRKQTMPVQDFEILFVNNCSTDNAQALIEAFAAEMPHVRLINKAVNSGGPFQSMNDAIDAARGRYIHFLDSDDFLCDNALERLVAAAEQYQSDIVFGRYTGVNSRHVPDQMFKRGNLPKADLYNDQLVFSLAPHKMFRISFLRQHNLKFYTAPATTSNEDQLFTMQCYIAATTITVLADLNHYFVVARGSENITSKIYPADKYLRIPNLIIQHIDEHVPDKEKKQRLKGLYANRALRYDHLPRHLLNPDFPPHLKKEWLLEASRFLQAALTEETMHLVDDSNRAFAQAVYNADAAALDQLAAAKKEALRQYADNRKIHLVTARQKALPLYIRPSESAAQAPGGLPDAGKPLQVFYTIKGWFELRLPHGDGKGTYSLFVQRKNVRYTLSFIMQASVQRFKRMIA